MRSLRIRSKPSPALAVSILALCVALAGTAFAGPIAQISLSKKEKKQTKNISRAVANAVLAEKAATLSVAAAGLANVAKSVEDNSITGEKIADGAVSAADLADAAVTLAKLAKDSVDSSKVVDGSLLSADLADGAVGAADLADAAVTLAKLANDSVDSSKIVDSSIVTADLALNSVGSGQIATDAVGATEMQDNSIDSGEIVDFTLTNQDVGVLFAEVDQDAGVDNSSGGVTAGRVGEVGTGAYEVDFGRNVASCTAVATIGPSGTGIATGQVNVADRNGNPEAVFVDTNDSAGTAADRPFRLVVVC